MSLDAWIAAGTVAAVFVLLATTRIAPYLLLLGGVTVLMALGVLSTEDALAGFSNPGMITVGALFVVAAGLNETGLVATTIQRLLGQPRSVRAAQARLILPVTFFSAFLNNTPIVAMMMPVVNDWGKRISIPVSQLLIPLSYAAILGGLCTLIGTSTNLVVHGLLLEMGRPGLHLFDITWVGLPCALAGVLYLLLFGRKLLPSHEDGGRLLEDPREYTLEMLVEPGGPLVGQRIEQAGLRHLRGVFLAEIHRRGKILPAVGPEERLEAEDQLIFVGQVDSIMDLQKIPGLRPATKQLFKLDSPRSERCFVEAVISHSCPLVGTTIREGRFRTRYNAVVIGVARNGERIQKRIGDIILQPGDVLLLEGLPSFVEQQKNSNDFYLVSRIEDTNPPRYERAPAALLIISAMVLSAAFGILSMLQASLLAAGAMLISRCCSEETARRKIDWQLLVAIGASFALGRALEFTGVARAMAEAILGYASDNPWVALAVIYGITVGLSELITNNAAAVLVFPIAMATAANLDVNHMPFAIAVMVASSASFATPIGYQTNLMVYGAGGYRFADFVRVGLPLNLVLWVVTVLLTPLVWPF